MVHVILFSLLLEILFLLSFVYQIGSKRYVNSMELGLQRRTFPMQQGQTCYQCPNNGQLISLWMSESSRKKMLSDFISVLKYDYSTHTSLNIINVFYNVLNWKVRTVYTESFCWFKVLAKPVALNFKHKVPFFSMWLYICLQFALTDFISLDIIQNYLHDFQNVLNRETFTYKRNIYIHKEYFGCAFWEGIYLSHYSPM